MLSNLCSVRVAQVMDSDESLQSDNSTSSSPGGSDSTVHSLQREAADYRQQLAEAQTDNHGLHQQVSRLTRHEQELQQQVAELTAHGQHLQYQADYMTAARRVPCMSLVS